MSIGTPDGQLIIENATVITNNINVQDKIGVVTNSPQYNLDVHGTANVGVLQATNIITDNVTAQYFLGDGGLLSNIAANLQQITTNSANSTNCCKVGLGVFALRGACDSSNYTKLV